jgi:hypothetical protein
MVSEIDTGPQLYVPREAKLSSVPTPSVQAERPYLSDIGYFLVVGSVAAAVIGALFGSAFSLLMPSRDKTVVGAGAVSSASEQAVSTLMGTANPGDPLGITEAFASTAVAPEAMSDARLSVPPPDLNSTSAAAKFTGSGDETPRSISDSSRTDAQPASRGRRSAHHRHQPATQKDKQRTSSAAMDRAHRQNSSRATPTLTPPGTGVTNAIHKHTAPVRRPIKPVQSLTAQ